MNVLELTRALIEIESITPNEREIGNFLFSQLDDLARHFDGHGASDAARGAGDDCDLSCKFHSSPKTIAAPQQLNPFGPCSHLMRDKMGLSRPGMLHRGGTDTRLY